MICGPGFLLRSSAVHRLGHLTWSLLLIIAQAFSLRLADRTQAQNFVGEPQLVRTAESARVRSAAFWTGAPFSAPWSTPCPIRATSSGQAGGSTTFQFANGQVFGWRMEVSGSMAALLADVIPHEVDHMV